MDLNLVWEKFLKLPPERQREVAEFIEFLASQSPEEKDTEKDEAPPPWIEEDAVDVMWRKQREIQRRIEWIKKWHDKKEKRGNGETDPDRR